jgi:hypothetical protein
MRYYSGVLNLQQFVYFRKNNKNNMKKTTTSKFGLLMAMVAILISSCSTNATFSKRYHSRGFNIAWGGGSDANNNPVKQTPKKVKAKSDVVAQNTENVIVQSVNSTVNAVVEASTVSTTVVSNNILAKNEVATVKYPTQSSTHAVKSVTVISKKEILSEIKKSNQRTKLNFLKKGNANLNSDPEGPIFGILSFVFGLLGWITFPLLFGLAAIVLGIIGLNKELNGLAIAGLVLGALLLIIMVLVVAVLLAL